MKIGDIIFFFFKDEEKVKNNQQKIAPALVNIPWSGGSTSANITVFHDGWSQPQPKVSSLRATSLKQALAGECWASREDVESWGVNLEDPSQDLNKLLPAESAEAPAAETASEAPASEESSEAKTEGSETAAQQE